MSEEDIEKRAGVGPAIAEKLREAGYNDFMMIAVDSPKNLAEIAEIGESTAAKIIAAAKKAADVGGFETGDVILERRKSVAKLTSGSKALDELMGGGFESRAISEFFGEFGSGKCVSAKTELVYTEGGQARTESIEKLYQRFGEGRAVPFDDGYIATLDEGRVPSLSEGVLAKTQAAAIYKERVSQLFEAGPRGGRG